MTERILVVDDERPIAEILKYNLEREGYEVLLASDGEEALKIALEDDLDLIVLDIMMPKLDGYQVCTAVRQASLHVPILMLTAKDEEGEKVRGLDIGADDYVTKPFSPRELTARIRALLRRVQQNQAVRENHKEIIRHGELVVDLAAHDVRKNGQNIDLTVREYELLCFLLKNIGQAYTREELLEKVWGFEYYGDIRTVDVTVRRLREKIEEEPSQPRYIITKRGVGYLMRADEADPGT